MKVSYMFFFTVYITLVAAMPPHYGHRGPLTCIVGPAREHPKDLQNTTVETVAILMQFPDNRADTLDNTPARYDSMFYSTGAYYGQYRQGSLNDFFLENSYGGTNVIGGIAGDQWWMSNYNYSHYYDGYYMLTTGYELAADAVARVDGQVNFQDYDLDNDGHIDGMFVVHAGPGGEDTGNVNHCWSHAIPSFNYATNDGVIIDGVTNVPEINLVTPSLDTTLCCIGVMCHELGHIVGLPDLYDGTRNTWGVGYWSLMGYGAWGAGGNTPWSPSHADGWCKMDVNWLSPHAITSNMFGLRIPPMETHPDVYRVWRHGAINDTFFILENRQNIGFDTPLPGRGLLIWHIDRRYGQYHNIVDLEEADGCDDLDNGWGYRPDPHYYHHELGDSGDPFPGDSGTTLFNAISYPSSNDNWGNPTDITVRNIEIVGDTVICDVIIDETYLREAGGSALSSWISARPNPFRSTTELTIAGPGVRDVAIYDITGACIARLEPNPGTGVYRWDGCDDRARQMPPGIYLCVIETGGTRCCKKLILVGD